MHRPHTTYLEYVFDDNRVRYHHECLGPKFELVYTTRAQKPSIQGFEQGLIPRQVTQLALRNRDVGATDIGLKVALAHFCDEATKAILDIALGGEGIPGGGGRSNTMGCEPG